MKAVFKKTETGILPCCNDSLALFDKIKNGDLVMVEFIKGRNYQNHKRFMALCRVTFDLQDIQNIDELWRKHVIMIAGYFDLIIVPIPPRLQKVLNYLRQWLGGDMADGIINIIEQSFGVHYIPKSMAFDKMDELEFNDMFDKAINAFIDRYGNGLTKDELLTVIEFD